MLRFSCSGCQALASRHGPWFTALGYYLLPCSAQPSMQTILTNGPVSNRLNVVVLSEGYMTNQLAQFLVDATNAVRALLSHPPYQEYSNYFNAFAIPVASASPAPPIPSTPTLPEHLLQQHL